MKIKITILWLVLMASACIEKPMQDFEEQETIPQIFDYQTVNNTQINIHLTDYTGDPLSGVMVQLWRTLEGEKESVLFKAFTNAHGEIQSSVNLPTDISEVTVETNFIGVPNDVLVPVKGGLIDFRYENNQIKSLIIHDQASSTTNEVFTIKSNVNESSHLTFNYLGAYSSNGVPEYLEPERDQISASLLQYINASLPEKQPVPQFHPTYLANGKKTTLDIVETCDVWITFVHEGAGFRNAIGFYTYNSATPPQNISDISNVSVIFPNLSYAGSGGGLTSGDKVNIGRFSAGTSIGLVLMADGWDGINSEDYYHIVFGDNSLNPEEDEDLKQHNVLLWDDENELFLIGFEDILRDNRPFTCDNDFNDAILFVSSNPVEAISIENVSPIDKPGTLDNDGDGINDILDEYPNDGTRAYDSYYPSSTTYGTFAFEDNWPDYGDYDFNDLVVDYRFKHVLNAENEVVAMSPTFKIRAVGAGFRNGFGFATNLLPGDINAATGASLNAGYITNNGNGTEAGQANAVFIVVDNAHDLFNTGGFVNTEEIDAYHTPQEITLNIDLGSPKTYEEIGTAPYNPFLIVSGNRQREVHLPGYLPTDKADPNLFGTLDDDTNLENGIYYRSKTDLPWAIHLPESFAYPKEKADIRQGHLRFSDWSRSLGYSYMDWYRANQGYRSNAHLYNKE